MLTSIDVVVIVVYLIAIATLGLRLAGKQLSRDDYFLGGRNLPWWAVCFSVVATETSTLTVIGLPAIAYGGSLTFMQLTVGYLIGRTVVSVLLLPRYFGQGVQTTYGFLETRFGPRMRALAALTFMFTRLLADGVRLFATAIPIKVIADAAGFDIGYTEIVFVLVTVTLIYTYFGGIKAVVWVDAVQLVLYLLAGVVAVSFLLAAVDDSWWTRLASAGKTRAVELVPDSFVGVLTQPYLFVTAVAGGAVFSMASHGADQLMVQRLLTCRSLRDSQRALIGSAVLAMVQFALFLLVGLLLWVYYDGASIGSLGLSRSDEILPKFIVEGLPPGVSGLLLAGIVAAAMSTLSSSMNSLASSSALDLGARLSGLSEGSLLLPRMMTLGWALALGMFASLLSGSAGTVIEVGLTVASFTYGALLGVFVLAIAVPAADESSAIVAFLVTIVVLVVAVFGLWYSGSEGWVLVFRPNAADIAERGLVGIAWPWFPVIGVAATLSAGVVMTLLRGRHFDSVAASSSSVKPK